MIDRSANACDVRTFRSGDEVLALLSGALRMNESERVKKVMLALLSPPVRVLNLYLGTLQELDSAGLGILVGLHMTARKNKQELRILAPTPHQYGLFEMTRLTQLLTIVGGEKAERIREEMEKPELAIDPAAPPQE